MRHNRSEYRQLKLKLLVETILMGLGSLFLIFGIYSIWLSGKLANGIVSIFQYIFFMDYVDALHLYESTIRKNMSIIFPIVTLIAFLMIFAVYLNWFTKYFYEINRGIDELMDEKTGNIILLSELSATEKKLNIVKQTLEKRKMDSLLSEQRKNDLIVYLAHDLKTPLTSVIGYLSLIRDKKQISEEMKEKYIKISLNKAERLEHLINEFFEITRFNRSNIPLELHIVNLTRMLEQIIFEFKPMLEEKNLHCVLVAEADMTATFDINKMQRVFDNLLRNAVNYSHKNSEIKIIVTKSNEMIKISVINHGNTIPEEKLNLIFEQFYRLDVARTTLSGGAGLGLAITKEIVEAHGGTIFAASSEGLVTFEIEIPIVGKS